MKVVKNKYDLVTALTLGDGYIDCPKHIDKSMLDIAHHISHSDYINFKRGLLQDSGFTVNQNTKTNSNKVVFSRINTRYYKLMRDVRYKLYDDNTKTRIFPHRLAGNLKLFHFMILYLDDGSLMHRVNKKTGSDNHYIEIGVSNYDLKSVKNIQEWIDVLGYDSRIHQISRYKKAGKANGYIIRMNKSNSKLFLSEIQEYVCKNIPSMSYKVDVPIL